MTAMTRPQRRKFFGTLVVIGWLAAVAMFWGSSSHSWVNTMPPVGPSTMPGSIGPAVNVGTQTHEFGLLTYVHIETTNVDPKGVPITTFGPSITKWTWKPVQLLLTLLATIFVTVLGFVYFQREVARGRLRGYCDECGYDLTGLTSDRCPECGTPING